ncbi:hypothetical protein [Bradyrhizobium sp. Rc2d]|uniref:hypothetical protein n=1 Tax=Bradyrhizobium sp. Rc2d TaxID=1855321 RepID=UPI0015A2361C|nr:hypothetical protein [Bradyrhizobium sp. Rc2d]
MRRRVLLDLAGGLHGRENGGSLFDPILAAPEKQRGGEVIRFPDRISMSENCVMR